MTGRCAGCGRVESLGKVRNHILACPAYAELYAESPERCLSPEDEYRRWLSVHGRGGSYLIQDRFEDMDRARRSQLSRWADEGGAHEQE